MPLSNPSAGNGTVQGVRVATGTVGGASTATVTVTWSTAFANTNYTPSVCVLQDTAGLGLIVRRIRTKTASAITVVVENTAATDASGTLQACGLAD